MLVAYGILYDSMMAYFGRWYVERARQRERAAFAMSFLATLNVLSIAAAIDALVATWPGVGGGRPISLLLAMLFVLIVANRRFAKWRSLISKGPLAESMTIPRVYAIRYIVTSVAAFVASLVLLGFSV